MKHLPLAVAAVGLSLHATNAANIAEWNMGEDDPGAVAAAIGNTTTVDALVGFDRTRIGDPTYSATVPSGGSTLSMAFDGTGDYYTGSAPTQDLTQDFSYSFDANMTAAGGAGFSFLASLGGNFGGVAIVESGGAISIFNSGVAPGTGSFTPTLGVWHNYEARYTANGGGAAGVAELYVDGVLVSTFTGGLKDDQILNYFTIGGNKNGTGGTGDPGGAVDAANFEGAFNGLIDNVVFSATAPPAPGPIVISSPTTRTVVQRTSANIGSIPVSGTYTGAAPDSFEARALVTAGGGNSGTTSAWQTIDASPTGGTYSGTLTSIAAGGWYTLEVRSVTGGTPSTAITLEKIGVGDVFIIAGQSNAGSYGSPQATPVDDRVSRMTSIVSGSWTKASDPMSPPDGLGLDGSGGSAWTRLGDLLTTANNVPVGFVCIAVGGSGSFEWLPTTTYHTTRLRPAVQHFPSNGFRAILWHQGEGDAFYLATASLYASQMALIIAESRTDAGWAIPWYVCEAAAVGGTNNFKGIPVLAGQRATVFADSNVFLGPTTNEFFLEDKTHDGTHFNAAGLLDHATQWRDILAENTSLDVENHDFERNVTPAITGTGALADGAFYTINHNAFGDPSILDWRELLASGVVVPDGSTGYYNPGSSQYTNAVDTTNGGVMTNMDGKHVAYLSAGSAGNHYLQYRRKTLLPNHTYTFTVALGVRDNADTFGNAELKLLANGVTLANTTFTSGDLDTLQGGSATGKFTDATVTHTTGSVIAANQPVGIQVAKVNGGGTTYVDLDNVRLTATPTAFGAWQITHFGSVLAANSGPDDDPDGDGRTNLYEFTYNSDPNDATGISQPVTFDGTTFTVTRRIASGAGISYILQESTTLQSSSWTTVMNIAENVTSTSGDFETVAITKTSGAWLTGDRNFLRVMAVLN